MSHPLNYVLSRRTWWLFWSDAGLVSSRRIFFFSLEKKKGGGRGVSPAAPRHHTSLDFSAKHLPCVKSIKWMWRFEKDSQEDRVRPRPHFILLLNSAWRAAYWVWGYAVVWLQTTRYVAAGTGQWCSFPDLNVFTVCKMCCPAQNPLFSWVVSIVFNDMFHVSLTNKTQQMMQGQIRSWVVDAF